MTKRLLLASILSALLSGCASPPPKQGTKCDQVAGMLEYDACMRHTNSGYDAEQRAKYK